MHDHRSVLIAATAAAAARLERMLGEGIRFIAVHTIADAVAALKREQSSIALILSSFAFDESRMLDFLAAVKADAAMRAVPFVCFRISHSVLAQHAIDRLRLVCEVLGAADFIDFAALEKERGIAAAQSQFRTAVMKYLNARSPERLRS